MHRSVGLAMRPLPMASICCSPPLKRACLLVSPLLKDGEEAVYLIEILFERILAQACPEFQVGQDGKVREELPPFGHEDYALFHDVGRGEPVDEIALVPYSAGAQGGEADEGPQNRALPRPISPDDTHHGPFGHVEETSLTARDFP